MTRSWRVADPAPVTLTRSPALPLDDLLLDPVQVVAHLRDSVAKRDWLDAYLFAAGLGQLVDDFVHPDPASLRRAAAFLRSTRTRGGKAASSAATAAATVLGLTARTSARRAMWQLRPQLGEIVDALAGMVLDPSTAAPIERQVQDLLDHSTTAISSMRKEILRLPAAFRSFDQHPDDLVRLADLALSHRLSAGTPVCVVGVRTSGGYLAPLFAAALRLRGVRHVEVLTHRPHRPLLGDEVEQLQRAGGAGGHVVVIDDPPGSGTSLAASATAVVRAGVPNDAVVLAACTFSDAGRWPALLNRWAAVTLPWPQWSVHERLRESAIARTFADLVDVRLTVEAVHRTSQGVPHGRGHIQAEYRVALRDDAGRHTERDIVVAGAGLGYLGRHAIAVADAVGGWTPRVYGVVNGLLFRDAAESVSAVADRATAQQIAAYCAQRHNALRVRRDPTGLMRGRDPAWEVAAALLAGMFGRLGPVARPLLVEPATRRLLRVAEPSVVDGDTDLARWRVDPVNGLLAKLAPSERAFSQLEAACYDPVFDLAGAATDPSTPGFEAELRTAYERETGTSVSAESWLLYRLVHLWRKGRAGELDTAEVARRSAVATTEYLAAQYLTGHHVGTGPLCAIDLDGVLETDPLGYPVTTPAGALALRALVRHGYRPVLATGRSVADARQRCLALGLPGAVAEYGTALYLRDTDQVLDQRTHEQRALVGRLRTELGRQADIEIDGSHRYAVRARSSSGGPLRPAQVDLALRGRSSAVTVVAGEGQTDLTVAGLDKGSGVRALAQALGGDQRCVLAVGDGSADLPMLAAAAQGRAPSNAAPQVRSAGNVAVSRRSYQAGLSDAVAEFLGHRAGTCATCRPVPVSPQARVVLDLLRLREDGMRGLAPRTVRLAVGLARLAVSDRW